MIKLEYFRNYIERNQENDSLRLKLRRLIIQEKYKYEIKTTKLSQNI